MTFFSQALKLRLLISENENYNAKYNKMNIALKYSPDENIISIIVFKFILEVKSSIQIYKFPLLHFFYFQGMVIEKKSQLYIKITLMENFQTLSTKKVWCSNNKLVYDFSKEIIFNLNQHDANLCSILLEVKKHSGFGIRSEYHIFIKNVFIFYCTVQGCKTGAKLFSNFYSNNTGLLK